MSVKTVGLDLAKDVFQVHGISENGRVIFNKAIKRAKLLAFFETLPPCVIGMEACGSSHHWGRTLRKLGHDVRLMTGHSSFQTSMKANLTHCRSVDRRVMATSDPLDQFLNASTLTLPSPHAVAGLICEDGCSLF
jgi:hypothetical protein